MIPLKEMAKDEAGWERLVHRHWGVTAPRVLGSWQHTHAVLERFPPRGGEFVEFYDGCIDRVRYLAVCRHRKKGPYIALFRLDNKPVLLDKIATFSERDVNAAMRSGLEGLRGLVTEVGLRSAFDETVIL